MLGEEQERLLEDLLKRYHIRPGDIEIYRISMTHSSYLNEQGLPTWEGNERLEFLGDAVIGMVVTEALYTMFPESREGGLSKIKSVAVSRATLAKKASEMGLARPLQLGVGETKAGGGDRLSILAAVFESFVGALYLDLGFEEAKDFVLQQLVPVIEELGTGDRAQDDKSKLQELAQQELGLIPRYRLIGSEGPDHEKWFTIQVVIRGEVLGLGEGSSKKSAEQDAAKKALDGLREKGTETLRDILASQTED